MFRKSFASLLSSTRRVATDGPAAKLPPSSFLDDVVRLRLTAKTALAFASLFGVVNVAQYQLVAYDKQQALHSGERVPELAYHLLAVCGGWPAGYYAMERYNHKLRREEFQHMYLHSAIGGALAVAFLGIVASRRHSRLNAALKQVANSSSVSKPKGV
eukprot:GILK01003256.1.p1 GENE.GILK01003256.1~~GILK01003256.1.p1  ORF type:complete len:158 (-),score=10.51 GILK01003256.1:90-563(-)